MLSKCYNSHVKIIKIANTSLERSALLVFIRKLSNKLNALQLHWRLPNSARNLEKAEFGKNGRISNLPKPKFGATLINTLLMMI